jgi:hypothetical protein
MPFVKGHKPIGHRPKGSTTKPRLSDYLDKESVEKLVLKAVQMANSGNETLLKFVLEQHFGKAPQQLDMTSDGRAIQFVISKEIQEKNDINSVAK